MNKTVEQAEVALASAKAAYLSELERDSERSDGSGAQERRREDHQKLLRDEIAQCERDLEVAKRQHWVVPVAALRAHRKTPGANCAPHERLVTRHDERQTY